MNFFYVSADANYYRNTSRGTLLINLSSPPKENQDAKHINLKHIYFATPAVTEITSAELQKLGNQLNVISIIDKDNICNGNNFPIDITYGGSLGLKDSLLKIKNISNKDEIDIVIINGFGAAIGDIIIGTSALNIYDKFLKQYFKTIRYHVYNEHQDACKILLENNTLITSVMHYPSPITALYNYDALIDLGAMTSFPCFNDRSMFDFYLHVFGINADEVPPYFKRTKIFYDLKNNTELSKFIEGFKISKEKFLLFNPNSTTKIRNLNKEKSDSFLQFLIDNTKYEIIILHETDFKHPRITNLSEFSKTVFDYMTIISHMDKIITVDTSTYHISDTYNIPTVVIFTTIDPNFRIKYYPFCKSYSVLDKTHVLFGKHISQDDNDIKLLDNEVDKIDFSKILQLLEEN